MNRQEKAKIVYERLSKKFPDAHCELNHETPFQLLIATILSAQCTDVRVNMVTPLLFKTFPTPQKLAKAKQEAVEEIIRSTGFYKNKAKNIIGCAQALVSKHNSIVPESIEELSDLPGVGRKTANVVLSNCFNVNHGVVVDTHVKRITHLLGLTKESTPEKIEIDLMKLFPNEEWGMLSHLLIFHGRRTCIARRPQCDLCSLVDICSFSSKKSRSKN
ncbi:MAG: endonuclease III [Bacteriovoracaceae bacterium]|nr:endonuclease III [Bacteriovoracaceae bacterium]